MWLLTKPPALFCVSFLLFYAFASFWESLFHQYILDVIPRTKVARFKLHRWLPDLWFACFSHNVVHHYQTFRTSYVTQFRDRREEVALQQRLKGILGAADCDEVVASRYGLSFTWSSSRYFGLPLVLNLGWIALCPTQATALMVLLANLLGTLPYLIMSKYVHPYLHKPITNIDTAPRLMRVFLRSRYGLAIRVSHFVHHRDPSRNYNLQLLADLVRGRWRAPSRSEWDEMVRIGLVSEDYRLALEGHRVLLHPF
jgi:hypothetical protein